MVGVGIQRNHQQREEGHKKDLYCIFGKKKGKSYESITCKWKSEAEWRYLLLSSSVRRYILQAQMELCVLCWIECFMRQVTLDICLRESRQRQ
jgi:hypothetical protein